MVNLPNINSDPQQAWQAGFLAPLTPNATQLDTSGPGVIRQRQQQNERYAANPLQSPAAASSMAAINAQATRRAQSSRGAALGRAANTGSAGFAGAFQNTAAGIEEQKNTDIIGAQGQLASTLGTQYGQAATQLAGQYGTAVSNQNAQVLQQENQSAEARARQAQLQQQEEMERYKAIMEQARIAENARQFDVGLPLQQANTQLAQQQLELYKRGMDAFNLGGSGATRTYGPNQIR